MPTRRTRNINDVYERIMARMDERLDQFVDQFSNRMNDMMNLRRCGDRNGRRSEDEELGNPFFEGDCSSSNEWGDHGVAGDDYEGAPVFDDGYEEAPIFDDDQFEEESMPVYDTDIEDVIGEEEENMEDIVVVANDLCSSMIQTTLSVDFSKNINSNPHELIWSQKGNLVEALTRANLDKRGIDLDSVLCPICNSDIETESHVLVTCSTACNILKDVYALWHLPDTPTTVLEDLVSLSDRVPLEKKFKPFFDVVVNNSIWSLWNCINKVLFNLKRPQKELILNEIKTMSQTHSLIFITQILIWILRAAAPGTHVEEEEPRGDVSSSPPPHPVAIIPPINLHSDPEVTYTVQARDMYSEEVCEVA
ncbi:reverse transcriptase domain-containing protein [Tanacetum coccineum]